MWLLLLSALIVSAWSAVAFAFPSHTGHYTPIEEEHSMEMTSPEIAQIEARLAARRVQCLLPRFGPLLCLFGRPQKHIEIRETINEEGLPLVPCVEPNCNPSWWKKNQEQANGKDKNSQQFYSGWK